MNLNATEVCSQLTRCTLLVQMCYGDMASDNCGIVAYTKRLFYCPDILSWHISAVSFESAVFTNEKLSRGTYNAISRGPRQLVEALLPLLAVFAANGAIEFPAVPQRGYLKRGKTKQVNFSPCIVQEFRMLMIGLLPEDLK